MKIVLASGNRHKIAEFQSILKRHIPEKKELDIPVKFIGVGEKIDDMQPFCADDFISALFE